MLLNLCISDDLFGKTMHASCISVVYSYKLLLVNFPRPGIFERVQSTMKNTAVIHLVPCIYKNDHYYK